MTAQVFSAEQSYNLNCVKSAHPFFPSTVAVCASRHTSSTGADHTPYKAMKQQTCLILTQAHSSNTFGVQTQAACTLPANVHVPLQGDSASPVTNSGLNTLH
jgi:hypothetical protein